MCLSIGRGPQGLPSWPQGHRHFSAQLSSSQIPLSCPSPPVTVTQWMIYPFESYENCFLFYSTAEVQSGLLSSKSLSTIDAALQQEIYSWKSPSSRCQSHLGWQTFFFPFGMKQSLIHLRQYLVCGSHGSWQPITLGFAMKRLHIPGIWDGVKIIQNVYRETKKSQNALEIGAPPLPVLKHLATNEPRAHYKVNVDYLCQAFYYTYTCILFWDRSRWPQVLKSLLEMPMVH